MRWSRFVSSRVDLKTRSDQDIFHAWSLLEISDSIPTPEKTIPSPNIPDLTKLRISLRSSLHSSNRCHADTDDIPPLSHSANAHRRPSTSRQFPRSPPEGRTPLQITCLPILTSSQNLRKSVTPLFPTIIMTR